MFRGESHSYAALVERVDGLTTLEQLSLVVHPPDAECRLFAMMLCAFCDESEDTRAFVVSGILAHLPDWVELGRRWRMECEACRIPEFHAAKCEQRLPPFEAMEREQRDDLQRRFYGLIAKAKLWGFATGMEMQAFRDRRATLAEHQHGKPYFLAFQHTVESMAMKLEQDGYPRSEPIAFVFDQNQEHQGRALQLYNDLRARPGKNITYAHRLGAISFDSRFCRVELQAADVWAYESRKHISDVILDKRPDTRWQYEILHRTGRFGHVRGFNANALDTLANLLGWRDVEIITANDADDDASA